MKNAACQKYQDVLLLTFSSMQANTFFWPTKWKMCHVLDRKAQTEGSHHVSHHTLQHLHYRLMDSDGYMIRSPKVNAPYHDKVACPKSKLSACSSAHFVGTSWKGKAGAFLCPLVMLLSFILGRHHSCSCSDQCRSHLINANSVPEHPVHSESLIQTLYLSLHFAVAESESADEYPVTENRPELAGS